MGKRLESHSNLVFTTLNSFQDFDHSGQLKLFLLLLIVAHTDIIVGLLYCR